MPSSSLLPAPARLLEVALQAAQVAGEIHQQARQQPLEIRSKSHAADLVTQVDTEAEAAIRALIAAAFPEHEVLGEESPWPPARLAGLHQESCWVVDPLDGTQNYAAGLPLSCVSIAYLWQGEPLVGVVYQPQTGELYSAVRGQGATLNGQPLRVSARPTLDAPALLGTGFPRDIARRPELLEPFLHLTRRGLPVRRLGCAALSLAYLAAGRMDGYWDVKLAPWDVAAGLLLVQEAGGKVSNLAGSPYQWGGPLCVTNGLIHAELLGVAALADPEQSESGR